MKTTSQPHFGYRPALDGLRAIAVLAVVVYHVSLPESGGYLGVDVFFVLSGYLITSILLIELADRGSIAYGEFLRRRVRRLLPAALLVLCAVAILTGLRGDPSALGSRRRELLAAIGYASNWYFIHSAQSYFDQWAGMSPLRHMWSLSVEEQFYVLWPLALPFLLPRTATGRRSLVPVTLLALASAAAMAALHRWFDASRAYYGTDARVHEPLIGGILAATLAQTKPSSALARAARLAGPLAFALLLACLALFSDHLAAYYRGGSLLFCVLVAALIASIELVPGSVVARLLSVRPLVWTGKISYGLYLWHWPLIVLLYSRTVAYAPWVRSTVVLGLTFALAVLSFFVLERPLREGRGLLGRVFARATLSSAAVGMAAMTALVIAATSLDAKADAAVRDVSDEPCPGDSIDEFPFCAKWQEPAGRPVLATIGDSTSAALTMGLRAAARQRGITFVQATRSGCSLTGLPFLPPGVEQFGLRQQRCTELVPRVIPAMLDSAHPTVVLATERIALSALHLPGGIEPGGSPKHTALYREALEARVHQVLERGATLVFLETPPQGPKLSCNQSGKEDACSPPAASDVEAARYNALVREVASRSPGRVLVVSVTDIVCPDGRCPLEDRNGVMIRFDGVHFTGRFSLNLGPILLARIEQAGARLAPGAPPDG